MEEDLCIRKCGNLIYESNEECDLGLGIDNDGCNDDCTVEDNFVCTISSSKETTCVYNEKINLILVKMEKTDFFSNHLIFEFQV